MTEDEMVGRHHRLHGREFEQTLGNSEGQGSLACCSPWRCRVRDNLATEQRHGLYKTGTDELICKAGIEMQMWRMGIWTQGREGKGGMSWEIRTDMYTLPHVNS